MIMSYIEKASDATLALSRRVCHIEGLSSIVIGHTECGGLIRVFLAWEGLPESHLNGKLPLGIHDHQYGIEITVLSGEIVNTIYEINNQGRMLNHFIYHHSGRASKVGFNYIGIKEQQYGESFQMVASDIHNVFALKRSSWIVEEGPVVQEETNLWSPDTAVTCSNGFYESRDELVKHVRKFYGNHNSVWRR